MDNDNERDVIVAEISKNWPNNALPTVSQNFEHVISVNRDRGYRLVDWRFSQCVSEPGCMVETIIAVFEKTPPESAQDNTAQTLEGIANCVGEIYHFLRTR